MTSRLNFLNIIASYLPTNSRCIEIGVYDGEFSESILSHLTPEVLYLVDPWIHGADKNSKSTYESGLSTAYSTNENLNIVKSKFVSEVASGKVAIKQGFSYDFVDSFPDNYFDFIYIDATHLYESVKADLNMYLPKLKQHGLMCGHDYHNIDNFGVIRAVDEFILEQNFEWVTLSDNSDWAIKRK